MFKEERKSCILREINLHNKVILSALSTQLQVSEDTIRRDIKELAQAGLIQKVHGGAIGKTLPVPVPQNQAFPGWKIVEEIARKALKLIREDDVLLMDGGDALAGLARLIPGRLRMVCFTNSPLLALELVKRPRVKVITIGGELSKNTAVNIGAGAINSLYDIEADLCLLSAEGISVNKGITSPDWEAAQVKQAMIRSAKKLAVLCPSGQLNSVHPVRVCQLNRVNYLITELSPENRELEPYRDHDLAIL